MPSLVPNPRLAKAALTALGQGEAESMRLAIDNAELERAVAMTALEYATTVQRSAQKQAQDVMKRLAGFLASVLVVLREVNHGRAAKIPTEAESPSADKLAVAGELVEIFRGDTGIREVIDALDGACKQTQQAMSNAAAAAGPAAEAEKRFVVANAAFSDALMKADTFVRLNTAKDSRARNLLKQKRKSRKGTGMQQPVPEKPVING